MPFGCSGCLRKDGFINCEICDSKSFPNYGDAYTTLCNKCAGSEKGKNLIQKRLVEVHATDKSNENLAEIHQSQMPSYRLTLFLVVGAILTKILGNSLANSAINLARSSRSILGELQSLNQAATIQGATDVIMVLLILLGIFFLGVRTYLRKQSR